MLSGDFDTRGIHNRAAKNIIKLYIITAQKIKSKTDVENVENFIIKDTRRQKYDENFNKWLLKR